MMASLYYPSPGSEPTCLRDYQVVYELDDYHEDFGDVLWWVFPITESPYVGSPLHEDWPGYHTHWSKLLIPPSPEEYAADVKNTSDSYRAWCQDRGQWP